MSSWCNDCALRLYNTKHHNLQGIGNPWSGNCIVVPNVDYDAYKRGNMSFSKHVEVIKEVLISFTGDENSNLYVVPLIRCNETISCQLDDATYNKCLHWFAKDIKTFNFQNILLLGDAAKRFMHTDIKSNLDKRFISKNNRNYFVNYSPLISYVDQNKFDIFKKGLIKWYNAIIYNKFDTYETIYV